MVPNPSAAKVIIPITLDITPEYGRNMHKINVMIPVTIIMRGQSY